ncbi:MAG: reverse transcriptase domain-containing protein [Bacteroidia bacterium]|jgi:retron-type reverse transcriptase
MSNLYKRIISIDNLTLADQKARKGKVMQYGVKLHDQNRENNILALHQLLSNKQYKTSEYTTFKVYEPKERVVYRLPYYPDRIVHHAIMNILKPMFLACFTADTFSCIEGRGIHSASFAVRKALRDQRSTAYCLKLDITKFYPSVDHQVMKALIRKKIKDLDALLLLDEIIDSAPGLPIGNYLSQYLANFYLTYFDHWTKEVKNVKHYFRYADDIVVLHGDKQYLHHLLAEIKTYLAEELKLQVKGNYQVFPVAARGIDFVGYRSYHTHTLLRKSIKKNFARKIARQKQLNPLTLASYNGWTKHCDGKNLLNTLLHDRRI